MYYVSQEVISSTTAMKFSWLWIVAPPGINKYEYHKVFTFDNIYKYFTTLKLYQIMSMQTPNTISEQISTSQIQHNHFTRFKNQMNLRTPLFHKSKCQNSFVYQSVKLWNNLPLQLKRENSFHVFKNKLKEFLLFSQH